MPEPDGVHPIAGRVRTRGERLPLRGPVGRDVGAGVVARAVGGAVAGEVVPVGGCTRKVRDVVQAGLRRRRGLGNPGRRRCSTRAGVHRGGEHESRKEGRRAAKAAGGGNHVVGGEWDGFA